jgi:hypothetical protein
VLEVGGLLDPFAFDSHADLLITVPRGGGRNTVTVLAWGGAGESTDPHAAPPSTVTAEIMTVLRPHCGAAAGATA